LDWDLGKQGCSDSRYKKGTAATSKMYFKLAQFVSSLLQRSSRTRATMPRATAQPSVRTSLLYDRSAHIELPIETL